MSKSKYRMITIGFLFSSLLLLGGCQNAEDTQARYGVDLMVPEQTQEVSGQEEKINDKTVQPELGEYIKSVSVEAAVYYPKAADLFCEIENAFIKEILVKQRQEVKEGDALLTFDIKVSEADIQELSLKLERHLEDAEREKEERISEISHVQSEAEGLAGDELELALLKEKILQAEYDEFVYLSEYQAAQYEEQIESLQLEIENNTVTAPFDGVIDYVGPYNAGDQVREGQLLVKMHADEKYCLAVEDIAGNLRYNMDITVTAGPKNDTKTYHGKVVTAYNVLTSDIPEGKVLIRLEDAAAEEELQVGLTCHADVEKLQDVLVLDRKLIGLEEEKSYVSVLDGETIQKRYIVEGLRNTKHVWVVDGLSEGQKVIAK